MNSNIYGAGDGLAVRRSPWRPQKCSGWLERSYLCQVWLARTEKFTQQTMPRAGGLPVEVEIITMAFICRGGGWTAWASWRQSGVIGGKENNGFRTLERTLRPKEPHIAAHAERQHRCTPEFKARYDARTRGEGSLSQGHSGLRSAACPTHRHGQAPARTYPDRRLAKPTPPWRVVCRDPTGTHAHRPVRHIGTSLNVSLEGLAGIRQRYQTTTDTGRQVSYPPQGNSHGPDK